MSMKCWDDECEEDATEGSMYCAAHKTEPEKREAELTSKFGTRKQCKTPECGAFFRTKDPRIVECPQHRRFG